MNSGNAALDPLTLEGQVVLLTGCSGGIGRATVGRLRALGAHVVGMDLRAHEEARDATAGSSLNEVGGFTFVEGDVTDQNDWVRARTRAHGEFGRLDHVVNNAFTATLAPLHQMVEADWSRQIAVTLGQVYQSVVACMDDLRSAHGSVVNVSSVHARASSSGFGAYSAAKGAVSALTKQLAVEYAPEARVNAVLPGVIDIPNWASMPEKLKAARRSAVPLRRFGCPSEEQTVSHS